MLKVSEASPRAIALAFEARIPSATDRLLPLPVVLHITSLSKSKLYADIQSGKFPRPVNLNHYLAGSGV